MKRLAAVVGHSPRTVKRLVKVYRLVRSGMPADQIEAFANTRATNGPFRVAVFLLGTVVGEPIAAQYLFQRLLAESGNRDLANLTSDLAFKNNPDKIDTAVWDKVATFLDEIRLDGDGIIRLEEVHAYLHKVSRYSFVAGKFELAHTEPTQPRLLYGLRVGLGPALYHD